MSISLRFAATAEPNHAHYRSSSATMNPLPDTRQTIDYGAREEKIIQPLTTPQAGRRSN